MRQLKFDGPYELRVEEAEPLPLAPGEVRVRTHAVGVCGSDVHGYTGTSERRVPGMVMGHEAAGTVAELGPEVEGLAVGDPVAINPAVTCGRCEPCTSGRDNLCEQRALYGCVLALPGAFADLIAVRAANVVPLEGPAPLEWGALVEPLAVGDHGVRLLGPDPGAVVVVGGGPIGLGAALAARRHGATRVVVAEPMAHRREVLEALRLETVDPTAGEAPGRFAAAVECVAAPATLRSALELVEPGGTVVLVGMGAPELPLPVASVVVGERALRGSFNYTRESFADVARWVMSGAVDLSPVIESRVPLEGLVEVFAQYGDGSRLDMKTLFAAAPA